MFEEFKSWYAKRHDYARDWLARTAGEGEVVATMCTYAPEEILIAAGMLPVRVLGAHQTQNVAEPHIFGMFCPFSRDSLAQGLLGRYDYCSGLVLAQSCLHYRQTFTSWRDHVASLRWDYYLPMPNEVQSPFARALHREEVARFCDFVGERRGAAIGAVELRAALELVDENRRLLRRLFALRQAENPPLTGAEALYASLTAQFVDKREHNRALQRVLDALPQRAVSRAAGVRLMTIGSENDDVGFMEMIESLGATIVIDDQCSGTRNFWNEARAHDDPLAAIADRYCARPACPTKDYPAHTRFAHVLDLAREYRVEAAIFLQQKFCDPHEGDYPGLKQHLENHGIPTLLLEFDITNPLGPFRTRIEAFLETLAEEDLF
ncbi:C-subunit of benzoyl-CoA reductase [Sterolibacterium denitrificans]|uniref:C-subunit of benzoyl-CoA reductase n=1 Tax=Sterolibacterium denitrificans TaxID=157592 RepID=A0A7Z7HS50_9PROT|nr:benzoyl-CoA reductase, bzd-type, subunit N [Sterolibacterium denitrificans]SMB27511.1 C-subunit of benzoyl-CoA reductase [Sterolibacterium denitrificans]